jgi:hypothetical protein
MTRNRNRLCFSPPPAAPSSTAVVSRLAGIKPSRSAGMAGAAGLLALAVLTLTATATPAQAEVFHVKMRNGSTVDTLYQPQQAAFDPNVVILLSDAGNWIGINQRDIESVRSESDIHGFGVALNFNTIAIGWAPNDAPENSPNSPSATLQALQNIYRQQQAQEHYTIPQFVNTDQTAGIPARLVGGAILPGVPAQVPQLQMPLPAAPAAPQTPGGGAANQQ